MRLEWRASRDAAFHVERAPAAHGPFERLTAAPVRGASGKFEFEDETAVSVARLWYRLAATGADGTLQFFGPYAAGRSAAAHGVRLGAAPNPFNPSTELRFELPHTGKVQLRVVDARGRSVAVLLDGAVRAAGSHVLHWDARDSRGGVLPSGVYWAQLDAQGTRRTTRLVLVR